MDTDPTTTIDDPPTRATAPDGESDALLEEDLLVEDVSIDGMCGVY